MAGKLSHLGYVRRRAADGFRWYRDGVRVSQATVDRARRSVDAATRRREAREAPAPAPRPDRSRAARVERARSEAIARGRAVGARRPPVPERPLAVEGFTEAEKARAAEREMYARAGDATGAERLYYVSRARHYEAVAKRAELGAATADAKGLSLDSPIALRGSFVKWRDARGRFVAADRVARMSDAQRATVHREIHTKAALGQHGPRVRALIKQLRIFEREGLTWGQVGEGYYRRAVALALV